MMQAGRVSDRGKDDAGSNKGPGEAAENAPSIDDPRVVMTLDAGGTSFRFMAVRGGRAITATLTRPSYADDLERCLATLVEGFSRTRDACPEPPQAISFAFPGPADYRRGVIVAPPNMPAFRHGVALGPLLEDRFGLPVFINNDGNLFAYGEAIAGLLPQVNELLARAGSTRRYHHLLAVTLGTGFGGGLVCNGELHLGDNSISGEMWLFRNKRQPQTNAEEGASIRAVRRVYAERAGIAFDAAPDPREIFEIGSGRSPGDQAAAVEAFRQLGEVAGDAIAQACALVDPLVVVGGGISGSWPLFLPALIDEMNGRYRAPTPDGRDGGRSAADGGTLRRLTPSAYSLEDPEQLRAFLESGARAIAVPGGGRQILYEAAPKVGVGVSRLGTTAAIAVGAYAFALKRLGPRDHPPPRQGALEHPA
jgi:glucokinase